MMQGGECTLHFAGLQAMSDQDTAKGSGCIAVHWEKSERKYRPDRESTRVISKEGEGSADGSAAAATEQPAGARPQMTISGQDVQRSQ